MLERVQASFRDWLGHYPHVIVQAPGRVNMLGAHVDYNEGWVLPAAINRAIWVAASPATADGIRVRSLDFAQEGQLHLSQLRVGEAGAVKPTWLRYLAGVAWAMLDAGHELVGVNAVIAGNVPIGAGVSSSAAVEVSFAMALEGTSGFELDGVERARLCQRADNEFLGIGSGIMDQFASIHGAQDHLILLDCRSLDYELVGLPAGMALLVADTGTRRQLVDSEYNLRRQQCFDAVEILSHHLPDVRALRDVTPSQLRRLGHHLPEVLRMRAEHVVGECARVHAGVHALKRGDLATFGQLVRGSHESSRDLYEVSTPELDVLAKTAWQAPGCVGARLTGAGFGGCVVALVEEEASNAVAALMAEEFEREFGRRPTIHHCNTASGASHTAT